MKVVVAYASKYGSTKGIAEFIGDKLRQQGMQVDVLEVGAVRNAADYDAFVIGSAVYMFHWTKEAKQFVSKNRALLASHPVWLFSSGPVGSQSKDAKGRDVLEVSGPKELDELRALVKPRDHRVFFGALDGARLTGTIGFTYRLVRRSQAARESMPEGDFRDWKAIEAWAVGIAQDLKAPDTPQP
jgi:menaquinone-dependent protoporphyrinogen oxidase